LHSACSSQDQNAFYVQLIFAKRSQVLPGPQRNLRTPDTCATMKVTLLRGKTE
jgi:hypothetical protein